MILNEFHIIMAFLIVLNFMDNSIDDSGRKALADALESNITITRLDSLNYRHF